MSGASEHDAEDRFQYTHSGPGWVTKYILDMHRYYLEDHGTAPLNWSAERCAKYLAKSPYTRVSLNLLPLIEELNQKKRNLYATKRDMELVHERYLGYVKGEEFPLITCDHYDDTELPTSRLSDHFVLAAEQVSHHQTFWLTPTGWKIQLEKLERSTEPDKEQEKEDEEGNYVDFTPEQKLASGADFRNSVKGMKLIDWIAEPELSEDLDPNVLTSEELQRPVGSFNYISKQTIDKLAQRHHRLRERPSPDDEDDLFPEDSASNPDHYNILYVMATQGWDDDPTAEEIGWDITPVQNAEVVDTWGAWGDSVTNETLAWETNGWD